MRNGSKMCSIIFFYKFIYTHNIISMEENIKKNESISTHDDFTVVESNKHILKFIGQPLRSKCPLNIKDMSDFIIDTPKKTDQDSTSVKYLFFHN